MRFPTLLSPLLVALPATSMFILLPLYEDPGTNAAPWNNVVTAVKKYPTVQWQIIINPNSGPGTTTYPSVGFQIGITSLNANNNVLTLGYVDTANTQRPYVNVTNDVDTYANWAYFPNSAKTSYNISMAGIFFDDVLTASPPPTSAQISYYSNAAKYAFAQVPSDVTPVIFNPGALGPTQLFDECSTMVEFESPLSVYGNGASTINSIPSGYVGQSAIIVYNATSATNVKTLVHTMAQSGVEAVYVDYGACFYEGSPTACYTTLNLAYLEALAAAVLAG